MPLSLRGRLAVGGRELGLVALVAALALCVVAGIAWRSSSAAASPMTAHAAGATAPSSQSLVARATSSGPATVLVDVAGEVRRPQVVRLHAGSRVEDALRAAGGSKPGVDTTNLNLARVVADGDQIVVGRGGGGASPAAPGAGSGALVSLNQASESDLDALPGIGPVTAKNIVAWRDQHGRFSRIDELQEIAGIGSKMFAKLKPLVSL